MKRWLIAGVGVTVVLGLVAGRCGSAGGKLIQAILDNHPEGFSRNYPAVRWCGNGIPLLDRLPELLSGKTYFVMLLNNTELRPSGGFMGSYVKLKFEKGTLALMHVEDIYQPDGQLPGHVEPPYPIQEAFGQGWWKLRDANWDADFASAAATTAWFLEQGGEGQVDGIVAVNLDLFKKWVGILGGVKTFSYDQTVTEQNLYQLAQAQAEVDFKPGSAQKRDFLGAVGTALVERTKNMTIPESIKLARLFLSELKSGQMLIWMRDAQTQKIVEQKEWGGRIKRKAGDMTYVVETNLGANKANCCVKRNMSQTVNARNGFYYAELVVNWKNENLTENPQPPKSWGGNYIDYVRVIIPEEAQIAKISVNGKTLRKAVKEDFGYPNSLRQGRSEDIYVNEVQEGWQMVGAWVVVPALGSNKLIVDYQIPDTGPYQWHVVRQPGIDGWSTTLTVNGKKIYSGFMDEKERIFAAR